MPCFNIQILYNFGIVDFDYADLYRYYIFYCILYLKMCDFIDLYSL